MLRPPDRFITEMGTGVLRKEEAIELKLEYILANPVRAGCVSNPLEYRWIWRETGDGRGRPSSN